MNPKRFLRFLVFAVSILVLAAPVVAQNKNTGKSTPPTTAPVIASATAGSAPTRSNSRAAASATAPTPPASAPRPARRLTDRANCFAPHDSRLVSM